MKDYVHGETLRSCKTENSFSNLLLAFGILDGRKMLNQFCVRPCDVPPMTLENGARFLTHFLPRGQFFFRQR